MSDAAGLFDAVGFQPIDDAGEDLDCTTGDLRAAYDRGWNAALVGVRAFLLDSGLLAHRNPEAGR